MLYLSLNQIKWLTTVASVFLLAASCMTTHTRDSVHQESPQTTTPIIITPVISEPDLLDGTQWELTEFTSRDRKYDIPAQPQPLLLFNKGILGFQTGCNDITGYYALNNDRITITLREKTLIDCNSFGSNTIEIEENFFAAMETFDTYTVEDGHLHIQYTSGELTFRQVSD